MKRKATTSVPVFHLPLAPDYSSGIEFGTVAYGIEMPRWVLICAQCKTEFEHSQAGDTGMSRLELPAKPDASVCPAWGYSTTYLRTDLLYRSKAASS
jgi:hypothetical protein